MKQALNTIASLFLSPPVSYLICPQRAFSRYRFLFLLAGFTLLMNSCRKEGFQSNSQEQDMLTSSQKPDLMNSLQNQNLRKNEVPLKAKFTVDLRNGVVGTGEGTHIGKFTLVSQDNNENFPYITGTTIITAASGDQIFATHTGFFQVLGNGIAEVDLDGTITGGTGRFARVTGSYENHVIVDEALGTGSGIIDGTINIK